MSEDALKTVMLWVSLLGAPASVYVAFERYLHWGKRMRWGERSRIAVTICVAAAFVLNAAYLAGLIQLPKPSIQNILNRHYVNENVRLDYHGYYQCTFTNVTFDWDGGPFVIDKSNAYIGAPTFHTTNPIVKRSLLTFDAFKSMFAGPMRITWTYPGGK